MMMMMMIISQDRNLMNKDYKDFDLFSSIFFFVEMKTENNSEEF